LGLIIGISEFVGYGLRFFSGYLSDKTKAHWIFLFVGYSLLISIPLLSLTGVWQFAALLIVIERLGKGLRSPSRDTLVSLLQKKLELE